MTIVTVEVHLDERDVRAMEDFLNRLMMGRDIGGAGSLESRARQRCKRYGYADYWRGKWSITDAGREYVNMTLR